MGEQSKQQRQQRQQKELHSDQEQSTTHVPPVWRRGAGLRPSSAPCGDAESSSIASASRSSTCSTTSGTKFSMSQWSSSSRGSGNGTGSNFDAPAVQSGKRAESLDWRRHSAPSPVQLNWRRGSSTSTCPSTSRSVSPLSKASSVTSSEDEHGHDWHEPRTSTMAPKLAAALAPGDFVYVEDQNLLDPFYSSCETSAIFSDPFASPRSRCSSSPVARPPTPLVMPIPQGARRHPAVVTSVNRHSGTAELLTVTSFGGRPLAERYLAGDNDDKSRGNGARHDSGLADHYLAIEGAEHPHAERPVMRMAKGSRHCAKASYLKISHFWTVPLSELRAYGKPHDDPNVVTHRLATESLKVALTWWEGSGLTAGQASQQQRHHQKRWSCPGLGRLDDWRATMKQ